MVPSRPPICGEIISVKICEHLRQLEDHIKSKGFQETFRGKAWSDNCRTWVYFDVVLDCDALIKRFGFPDCVKEHEHIGTHIGTEIGLVCEIHQDGVMGIHPKFSNRWTESQWIR